MDFYTIQVHRINLAKYPKDYLTRQILQVKRFMDQHFAGNICLERVAQQAFLSKFHFIRLFKSYYGNTPFQYLTAVRIPAAKKC